MSQNVLSILLADDEPIVRNTIGGYLRESGHQVQEVTDGIKALHCIENRNYDLGLIDIRMPGIDGLSLLKKVKEIHPELSVVLITAHGNMETTIQALRSGATDFLTKPIKLLELDAVVQKSIQNRKLKQERRNLSNTTTKLIQISDGFRKANQNLLGDSEVIRKVRSQIQQVVEAGFESILLTGETGTGKEVVAREIHSLANLDKVCPFIAVNCPSLPSSLIESELFGHVKGAFTGATIDRAGYFELADTGTLFLDEVGDLSPSAQAKLLRVLETRTLRRIGGSKEIQVDVRVIAASNVDLEKNIEQGKIRRDLYYRLNAYTIHLLPLRERKEDIIPLARHFFSAFASARGIKIKGFTPQAEKLLLNYEFPGNIRELKNIVERAVVHCKSNRILPEHLSLPGNKTKLMQTRKSDSSRDEESTEILMALKQAKWNRRIAARNLGLPYSTLRFKIQKFGIK